MKKLISIIIPAHNEEKSIKMCLEAIKKQKSEDIEVIVVNDGSVDRTVEIAKKTKVPDKILSFENGHSAAFGRNRGSKIAKGEWLAFIDADQKIEMGFIKKLRKYIQKINADAFDYLVYSYRPKTIFQKAWSVYRINTPTMNMPHIIKMRVFKKLGGFNEKIFYYEDGEFKERFLKNDYKYGGLIHVKIFHIDPETLSDFIRQRKWQGKMAPKKYFLPCLFPPLMLIQFLKIWWKSKQFKNTIYWIILDFIGRYISLLERIKHSFSIHFP